MKIEDLKIGENYIDIGYNRVRVVRYVGYYGVGSTHAQFSNVTKPQCKLFNPGSIVIPRDIIPDYIFEYDSYLFEFLKLFVEG